MRVDPRTLFKVKNMDIRDKPAYHQVTEWYPDSENRGLTKREMFAMAAMQGLLSNPQYNNPTLRHDMVTVPDLCAASISYADELIKQLEP